MAMTPLAKKLDETTVAHLAAAQAPHGPTVTRSIAENDWVPEAVRPHQAQLAQHLARPEPDASERMPESAGIQTKHVVRAGADRFLLKPYHEVHYPAAPDFGVAASGTPATGWAEMTSQALYHAGGIGRLHQQVHVVHADHEGRRVPLLAIRMSPEHHAIEDHHFPKHDAEITPTDPNPTWGRFGRMPHAGYSDAATDRVRPIIQDSNKIAVMDFLAGNSDRHHKNLMVDPEHQLLAIDHGMSYAYRGNHFSPTVNEYVHSGALERPRHLIPQREEQAQQARATMAWWREHGPAIKETMTRRLDLIKHHALREHVKKNFEERAHQLDVAVKVDDPNLFWDTPVNLHLTPGLPEG